MYNEANLLPKVVGKIDLNQVRQSALTPNQRRQSDPASVEDIMGAFENAFFNRQQTITRTARKVSKKVRAQKQKERRARRKTQKA